MFSVLLRTCVLLDSIVMGLQDCYLPSNKKTGAPQKLQLAQSYGGGCQKPEVTRIKSKNVGKSDNTDLSRQLTARRSTSILTASSSQTWLHHCLGSLTQVVAHLVKPDHQVLSLPLPHLLLPHQEVFEAPQHTPALQIHAQNERWRPRKVLAEI